MIFEILCSMISFYNNNKAGGKYDNFLTLTLGNELPLFIALGPDFGWGNCLSLTLNE